MAKKPGTSRRQRRTTPKSESNRALAFLARWASESTAVLSLPALIERALESLREEAGFDSCTIALLDDRDPDLLVFVGATGVRAGVREQAVPRGEGLSWAVLEAGTPLYVEDMHADPRVLRRDDNVRSGIYAPMIVRGTAIGVLSAHRAEVDAFTSEDLGLLTTAARYLAGAFEVVRLADQLRMQASTDALTGLANRRFFLERLETELRRSRRSGRPVSAALVDLDGFKIINDVHGHAVGDAVLLHVAEALKGGIRAYDLAARFGGDEFVLLFPETTRVQAEEILRRVQRLEFAIPGDGSNRPLTVSWGIVAWPNDGDTAEGLLRTADVRLHAMKKRE